MSASLDEQIEKAARIVLERRHVVAFSGAGVSKESGIPTFREPGGLWDRFEAGASGGIIGVISAHPEQATSIFQELLITFRKAAPNPGHVALAEMERLELLDAVITQNIDSLHREAGNTTVYELHGNIYRLRCLACGTKTYREREELLSEFQRLIDEMSRKGLADIFSLLPHCKCGGIMRPDFVSFGEQVQDFALALEAAERCRVMLILGTSGVVYPAASLPAHARDAGAIIIEVNPERSALTRLAHYFLQGQTGVILPILVKEILRNMP
jgi:NAD-dependent deacetylase